jgi:hypothetical protein
MERLISRRHRSMEPFHKIFEDIKTVYYRENPFHTIINQKEILNKNPLILYGCGVFCGTVVSVCEEFGINITAVCDTYKTGFYKDTGLEIISPER